MSFMDQLLPYAQKVQREGFPLPRLDVPEPCETCRYWKPETTETPSMVIPNGFGRCTMILHQDIRFQDSVVIVGTTDHSAGLRTHRSFGCNVHQPKE